MDVRNPKHPYYEQYRDIMSNPIFRHPKVLLWSGELPSSLGEHPGIRAEQIKNLYPTNKIQQNEQSTANILTPV